MKRRFAAASAPVAGRFGFLSLPPEVRNMIYELLLVRRFPTSSSRASSPAVSDDPGPQSAFPPRDHNLGRCLYPLDRFNHESAPKGPSCISAAILITCQQIHREASPLLYTRNAFEFNGCERACRWVQTIRPAHAQVVQDVTIWLPGRQNALPQLRQVLRAATGLRRLHLHTSFTDVAAAKGYIRTMTRTVMPWVEQHPTLALAMSRDETHPRGEDTRPAVITYKRGLYDYWAYFGSREWGMCITFAADEADAVQVEDGTWFDLEDWTEALWVYEGQERHVWTSLTRDMTFGPIIPPTRATLLNEPERRFVWIPAEKREREVKLFFQSRGMAEW